MGVEDGKGKKKDGKKKKGAGGPTDADDFDFDEYLQQAGDAAPQAEAAPAPKAAAKAEAKAKAKAEAKPKAEAKAAAKAAAEKPADDAEEAGKDSDAEEGDEKLDAKTLANKKKKEKKKAKKAEAGAGLWGKGEDAEAPAESAPAASSTEAPAAKSKPEPKKGGKEKKESAAVKAARERIELQKKLDEERRAFEEAERKRIEEEERIEREEEARLEAERQRKRDARAAKIQRQKEEGTYMTKSQKAKAARIAQLRAQFGFSLEEFKKANEEGEEGEGAEGEAKPKRRPLLPQKKKKQQQKPKEDEDAAPVEEQKLEEVPAPVIEEKEEKEEEPPADDDDWEKVAEKLEEEDAKGGDDSDKESDSGSSSGSSSSSSSSSSSDDFPGYRSPIICIMGHVDTGKTKLLDKIRRTNVQLGEAGGITQQIGATFFPDIALSEQTQKVDPDFEIEVPGLLIIDTPGHESFNNLRARGSSLCDMAILVIDIMHGLEPQTVESLEMLKKRRCPFIIALNKIDMLFQWNSKSYTGVREALQRQEGFVMDEFQKRFQNVMLQLNERGLNCALYWENDDLRSNVSIVPTSAMTGEGVPDLLYMIMKLTQNLLSSSLEVDETLQCTVIEVKNIEGLGTTIDVILVNGTLKEGDTIVLAGMSGPIVTTIRALLTPQPMKEMRVKGEYVHHQQISTSMGVKICAPGLEDAVCGTELLVKGPDDDLEELKEEVQDGFESILRDFEKQPAGVYVKASTLGSLEALLSFLTDMKIPVFDVGIGEVHKKDVKKACIMKEKKHPEYAVILAFDVKVNPEAKLQADKDDVQIMTADIIYHLQDKFKTYMDKVTESKKTETRAVAVFPVILEIDSKYVFHKQDPIILGCNVVGGQLRAGTPICVPEKDNLIIGHVSSVERDKKPVQVARRGATVCVKIEQNTAQKHIAYGRHFDHTNRLYSHISRASIDTLKEHFKDEMQKEDWELIIGMKQVFKIQ